MNLDITAAAWDAFRSAADATPSVTLRAGAAIDAYFEPPAFDPVVDAPDDAYLERYAFDGMPFLDTRSWLHYLPRLIEYTMRHLSDSRGMVTEDLLWSLRPPDRVPPRLGALTPDQEQVIVALLDTIVFGEHQMPERDFAMQVMEEWWVPGAIYRPSGEDEP